MGGGAAIVAETWPEEKRARAAGILQTAWALGFFLCRRVQPPVERFRMAGAVPGRHPAGICGIARPPVGERTGALDTGTRTGGRSAHTTVMHLSELFSPSLRRDTLVGSTLAFVAVFGLWGATNWARPSSAPCQICRTRIPPTSRPR